MDSQGDAAQLGATNASGASTIPPAANGEFHGLQSGIPPPPFFQGFQPFGGQMPFMFPHSFMPSVQGVGFPPPPPRSAHVPTIDLTGGSQKRGSQESLTDPIGK